MVCPICDSADCEGCTYGPGEIPTHLIIPPPSLCEVCNEYEGVKNSDYVFDGDEDAPGVWICQECEDVAQWCRGVPFDVDETPVDPYYELDGEYQVEFSDRQWGAYVSPFIDEERQSE